MQQEFIAVSATKGKMAISLRGKVRNIGTDKLDEIFEKNPYMKIGDKEARQTGYIVGEGCIGCRLRAILSGAVQSMVTAWLPIRKRAKKYTN